MDILIGAGLINDERSQKKSQTSLIKLFLQFYSFQVPAVAGFEPSNLSFFWFKQVLDRGPEQRESKLTVLCLLIIIILIIKIIIYYIIIKLLIMENHPSRNQKRNYEM